MKTVSAKRKKESWLNDGNIGVRKLYHLGSAPTALAGFVIEWYGICFIYPRILE